MTQVSSTKDQVSSQGLPDLSNRFLIFGKNTISSLKNLRADYISKPIVTQLVRSSTSIGANYSEAQNASSRKDFRNKIYIAKKEAQETGYWLHMLGICYPDHHDEIQTIINECQEITLILQSITNKLDKT